MEAAPPPIETTPPSETTTPSEITTPSETTPPSKMKRKKVILIAIGVVVILAGLYALRQFKPTDASFFPKCITHQWTGIHCPGCGATRAVHSLLRGEFINAIRFNPMLIIGGPILALVLWNKSRREKRGEPVMWRTSATIAAVMLVYFVARNLPTPSTSPLAPPVIEELAPADKEMMAPLSLGERGRG